MSGPGEILINPAGGTPAIFVEGNLSPARPAAGLDEWLLVTYGWGGGVAPEKYRSPSRFLAPTIVAEPAETALELVLLGAGATLPLRDAADERVIAGVMQGAGAIIDGPSDVGGYPALASGAALLDRDHDGMPDDWENEHGLLAGDPADGNADQDADGYTNIEEYLHALSQRTR